MHKTQTPGSATSNPEVLGAYSKIATGIKRPRLLKNRLRDAARLRPIAPFGLFERDADICFAGGGSWYYVTRPVYVWLAQQRAKWFGGKSLPMPERIRVVAKESAESDVAITCLALAGEHASTSDLATADREIREELVEKEMLVEEIERRLYAEKK